MASKKSDHWQSCESGYLVALSERAKSARRDRLVLRATAGVAALVCGIGVALWSTGFWSIPNEAHYGGIACHEVQENMPAMIAGTLPEELKVRIESHLRQCPSCREMMQKMRAGQAVGMAGHENWPGECPDCQWQMADAVTLAVTSIKPHTVRVSQSRPQLMLAREM